MRCGPVLAESPGSRDTAVVFALPLLQASSGLSGDELTLLHWQWPVSPWGWTLLIGGFALAAGWIVLLQRRDTAALPRPLRAFLLSLRLAALAILFVVVLSPQRRTLRESFRPSEVSVLVDVTGSMQQPLAGPDDPDRGRSRADAVRELLDESPLLDRLSKRHSVNVYTFGEELSAQPVRLPYRGLAADSEAPESGAPEVEIDWAELVEPQAPATRLGDAVDRLLVEQSGPLHTGVIILTDGALNAGRDVRPANSRAIRDETRLLAVGLGSTEPAVNLAVTRLIGPTDVQAGDEFDLGAYLIGQGTAGQSAEVSLFRTPRGGDGETELVERRSVTLPVDGQPLAVTFSDRRTGDGELTYRVKAAIGGSESRDDDNEAIREVRIFDRPFETLIIAGGPVRDYRFARNALYRHPSAEVDIWLQTGRPGISQESRRLLFEFPTSREDLFAYDAIVAFDPNWDTLSDEQIGWVRDWVADAGGGLLVEVGSVYTPKLAGSDERLELVRVLYPVELEPIRLSGTLGRSRDQVFPVQLTDEGRAAEFLQLEYEAAPGRSVWEQFEGLYDAYPTEAIKAGATVYAEFPNPVARGASGAPPIVAEQRYGQGTVLYLGSSELWRLRSLDEDVYDRLWVKMLRRVAQGRSRQGLQRGVWLVDGREQPLGQTIALRARLVSPQFTALPDATVTAAILGPDGATTPIELRQDTRRPTEYAGEFRPTQAGRHQLRLPIPGETKPAVAEVRVELPRLEAATLQQDRGTILRLVEETGGGVFTLDEIVDAADRLLPSAGQATLVESQFDDLWDRWWVLAAVVGLLGLEWLIRKLTALA